jgi:raffinose/stachyose/melibiose transport system permease protein
VKTSRRTAVLTSIVMIPVACTVGLPFYYIVVNTLKTQQQTSSSPLGLPSKLFFANYTHVLRTVPVLRSFANTLYVTGLSVVIMLLVGSMAAYAMAMRRTRTNRGISAVLLVAFLVPFQTILIPLYQTMVDAHLVDSLNGLVVLYSSGSIFCYFLIRGYISTVPFDIIEAARIDGCGPLQIFVRIVLPLIRPILATVAVFETMWIWNDFITPTVFLSSPEKSTIVLQVYSAVGQFAIDWPAFMTLTVIALAPMVVFFITMQRHIVNGLSSGAVKG